MTLSHQRNRSNPFLERWQILARTVAVFAAGMGILALLGWGFSIGVLTTFGTDQIPMAPSTALLFVLFGVLQLIPGKTSGSLARVRWILIVLGLVIAVSLFSAEALGIHPMMEHLWFEVTGRVAGAPVGHMSPLTAFCFMLAGAGQILFHFARQPTDIRMTGAFWIAALLILTSLTLIIAYLLGAPLLYESGVIPPALTTSLAFLLLGVSLFVPAAHEMRGREGLKNHENPGAGSLLVLVFVLASALIVALAYYYFSAYEREFREERGRDLAAIADLKSEELGQWRKERLGDGTVFFHNEVFEQLVLRYLGNRNDKETEALITDWLATVQRAYRYDRVALLDARGNEVIGVPDNGGQQDPHMLVRTPEILNRGSVCVLDLHLHETDGRAYMGVGVPVLDPQGKKGFSGLLLLRINPSHFLYPRIQQWPTPSKTAETLLVRRDGKDVLFLNDLRFQPDAALNRRIPLTKQDLPAARAILGEAGVVEGPDYRGVPVLAAIRSIADSPWYIVAKQDLAEINAPLREKMWWTVLVTIALLVLLGAIAGAFWQRNIKAHFRAIQLAERRYGTTLNSIGDGVIVTDASGRIELLNPMAEQMTGWPQDQAAGKPLEEVFRIINEHTRETVESPVHHVLEANEVVGLANHTLLITRSGDHLPIADSGAPIHSEDGDISGVVLVFSDQTKQRMTKRALLKREAKYRGLFNSIRDAILVTDTDRRIVDCNPAFTDLFGYELADIKGQPTAVMYESKQEFEEMGKKIRENMGNPNFIHLMQFRTKDGHVFTGETNAFYLKDENDQVFGFIGMIRDVTERVEKEAELKRIEWMLRPRSGSDSSQSSDETIVVPEYGDLVSINSSRRILDAVGAETLEEIVREYLDMLETSAAVYEQNGDYALGIFSSGWCRLMDVASRKLCQTEDNREALNSGKWLCHESCWNDASRVAMETGEPADIECAGGLRIYAVPVVADGEVVGSVNFGYGNPPQDPEALARLAQKYDVPLEELSYHAKSYESRPPFIVELARKRLQSSARLIGEIVERHQAQQERELLQDQLVQSQKMESVGRLAGGVAHDFNNMLSVIIGNVELALHRLKDDDPLREDLDKINRSAQRSASLTRQLLAFARKQTIAPKVLNLNETLEGMLNMLHSLIGEDIRLQWKPAENLWSVRMDPVQIDQILANLCVNARDAISGVGAVSIETRNVHVDEAYCSTHEGFVPGEFVVLSVSDDGKGMEAEDLEHLFEPFYTTKEVGQGTGLGLATVYGIVKQNEGFINVYSERGRGTTFRIFLPQYTGDQERVEEDGEQVDLKGGDETVLIVEDETSILEMGKMMLTELNYTVLDANTPAEALRLVGDYEGEIHLLITDVVMPEMNGRELAHRISALRPDIRTLFMSGYTADVIAHHGILDEEVQFIEKPFSMKTLGQMVRRILDE